MTLHTAKITGFNLRMILVLLLQVLISANLFAVQEIYLRAESTFLVMPDGRLIEMWGFAKDLAFEAHDGTVTVPGPKITIDPTETHLIIHLENNLPEPVSIIIPGQIAPPSPVSFIDDKGRDRIRSFTHETPSGNAAPVDYEWTNLRAGTFLYHSGSHPAVQVQMGLYGCLKKDFSNVPKQAYDGIDYVNDHVLIFSEIDPALHDAVQAGDYGPTGTMTSTIDFDPKYFLINGQAFTPAQVPLAIGQVNDRVLLRLINAGIEGHVPFLQYLRGTVVAEDGFPYTYSSDQCAIDLPAAKTKDVIVVPETAGTYKLYDHRLRLTNDTASPGGMLINLDVAAALPPAPLTPVVLEEAQIAAETGTETASEDPAASGVLTVSVQMEAAPSVIGDMDGNGTVDRKDLVAFRKYWRMRKSSAGKPADLNQDGRIDKKDVTLMLRSYDKARKARGQ